MISGLYTAASGLIAQLQQQDVIANNLANVNTTGYKKDTALYVPFPEMFLYRINDAKIPIPGGVADAYIPIGMVGRGVQLRVDGVRPDIITEGSYIETGNTLNFAIKGNGMFVVMTPQGIRYTRDGSFSLDSEGTLVTQDGFPVLGQRGIITIDGKDIRVDEAGRVFVDNNEIDTLRIAIFKKDDVLRKQGNNLFYTLDGKLLPEDSYVDYVKIKQGYLETSNVNVIREMVDMITAYRAYEAAQKAIQSHDQTLNKAVNDVGNIQI
ncbi:MAG: flagellar hook-basal body protein [Candidatus Goldbacteria bacterium]|nr:flagellar hook-basal body protein [Candidatus Goldiibacteriota bacterium]